MRREPTHVQRQESSGTPLHPSPLAMSDTLVNISEPILSPARNAPGSYPVQGQDVIPRGVGYDTTLERPAGFFVTPDTAPAGLSVRRSRWVAPGLLAAFAVGAGAINRAVLPLTHSYGYLLTDLARVPPGAFGKQVSVAVRPLFLLLALLFAVLLAGSPMRRIRMLVTTILVFCVLTLVTDLALTRLALARRTRAIRTRWATRWPG